MSSTVIPITEAEGITLKEKRKFQFSLFSFIPSLKEMKNKHDVRTYIHSIKVGIALVLVSLLFFLDSVYKEVDDDNAIWAVMTVVVIYEFYAGATLSKGLNRGIGTILGGGLGCLVAILGEQVGRMGNSIIVGISVFIFGGAATYCRLIPSIKRKYDYGAMIFILTFTLVAISGLRAETVIELARERLLMIVMGFAICLCTSLFIFPIWASDELHNSLVSKFNDLAASIEDCFEELFESVHAMENQPTKGKDSFSSCKSVLDSKSKEQSLVNFARWEPWHGKFGLSYPWEKYLKIGEVLRELAAVVLSLNGCLQSPRQPLQALSQSIEEPCKAVGLSIAWTLRELGESINQMRRCQREAYIVPKLKSVWLQLSHVISISKLGQVENADGLAIATIVFSLMEMVERLEELAKEVEELGELAHFGQVDV